MNVPRGSARHDIEQYNAMQHSVSSGHQSLLIKYKLLLYGELRFDVQDKGKW
jgi:hypothetical protein